VDPLTIALILSVLFAANFGVEKLQGEKTGKSFGKAGIATAKQAPLVFGAPAGASALQVGTTAFAGQKAGFPGGRTPTVVGPGQQLPQQDQQQGGDFSELFQQLANPENLQLLLGLLQPQSPTAPTQLPDIQPAQVDPTDALLAQILQSQSQAIPQASGQFAAPFTQRATQILQPRFGITPGVR